MGRTRLGGLLLLVAALMVAPATAHGEVVAGVTSSGKTALRKAAAARGKAATLTLTASAKDAAGNAASRTTRLVVRRR